MPSICSSDLLCDPPTRFRSPARLTGPPTSLSPPMANNVRQRRPPVSPSNGSKCCYNPCMNSAEKPQTLQGWAPNLADREELFRALNQAFDYRGDVTLTLNDGRCIEGYIF